MLQDLVMTAVNDGLARSKQLAEERMASVAGAMGVPGMPGMGGPLSPPSLR
jgi:DNA-binding protein YbaB